MNIRNTIKAPLVLLITALPLLSSETPRTWPKGDINLIQAAKNSDEGVAIKLLNSGSDPNSINSEGASVLYYAITNNLYKLIPVLIQKGVDLDYGFMETSPLFHAKMMAGFNYKGNTVGQKILKLMESKGAKFNDYDNAFVKLIKLKNENNWTSLEDGYLKAIESGNLDFLNIFIIYFHNTNKPITASKIFPLHYAALVGPPTSIRFLIEHGGDLEVRTDKGLPVIWFARKRPEIQSLLLELGAKPFDPNASK